MNDRELYHQQMNALADQDRWKREDVYGAVRRDEYSTLGDGYRMCRQDPEAFAAGAQYALDKMHAEWETYMKGIIPDRTAEFLSNRAAEILQRALDGEPQ